jgi:glucose-6-phosphate 1-epimerase
MIINLLGAQLLSAEIIEGVDIFYLSPSSQENMTKRGGIPIIFPQFGNFGKLKKHGYARDFNWVKVNSNITDGVEIVEYSLIMNNLTNIELDFEAELYLIFKLIKNSSLSIELQINNTGVNAFSFTGGLHPYFKIKSRKDLKIYGLDNSGYIDTDPKINSYNLNGDTGLERLFLNNSNIELFTGYNQFDLAMFGFENWMIWNPGKIGAALLGDLPNHDWDKFICIEPVIKENPVFLKPNQNFVGKLLVKINN